MWYFEEEDELMQEGLRCREQLDYESLVALDQQRLADLAEHPTEEELAYHFNAWPVEPVEPPAANEIDWEREIMLDESDCGPSQFDFDADIRQSAEEEVPEKGTKRKAEGKPRGTPEAKRLKSDPLRISQPWRRLRKYAPEPDSGADKSD